MMITSGAAIVGERDTLIGLKRCSSGSCDAQPRLFNKLTQRKLAQALPHGSNPCSRCVPTAGNGSFPGRSPQRYLDKSISVENAAPDLQASVITVEA